MEDVVILCGGHGTRLRERTDTIPKPLVEIGGRPILWHVIRIYAEQGFARFLLCLGHRGEMIEEFVRSDGLPSGLTIECRRHDGLATITVVRPELPFGVARLDGAGRVEGFVEKPRFDGWINGGFFCFERGVLDYLGEDSVLEREPFERLAADGQLRAYRHTGFWDCLDTYKDAVLLNDLWTAGRAPWKLWR